jgi:hypothetical protein
MEGKLVITKLKKVKFEPEYKNPVYNVIMECPEGNKLYIKFDYTYAMGNFMPLNVNYNGEDKGAKLAWYTNKVEDMTVEDFLGKIARRINKKYNFSFKK